MTNDIFAERQASLDAEFAVLGNILRYSEHMKTVVLALSKEDFYYSKNAVIYEKMCELWFDNKPFDFIILLDSIGNTGENKVYLEKVLNVPYTSDCSDYCTIIKRLSRGRKAAAVVSSADFRGLTGDIDETIQNVCEQLAEILRGQNRGRLKSINQTINEIYEDIFVGKKDEKLDTGIEKLDKNLDGLYPGDVLTIAAETGVGKTAFVLQIINNITKKGKKVALYSLEMSTKQNVQRMVSRMSGVPLKKIKNAEGLTDAEKNRAAAAMKELYKHRIVADEDGGLKVSDIRLECMSKKDIDVIVIDHIGLMKGERAKGTVNDELTQIMTDIKAMAKNLNIPVIVLCQLNREVKKQKNSEPQIDHLRGSGEIGQSSSAVVFLWQLPEYGKTGKIGVKVAKNRQGESGTTIAMRFNGSTMTFEEAGYDFEKSRVRIDSYEID